VRIDYVWSDGSPMSVQLINRNVTRGLSISDHLGLEVRAAQSLQPGQTHRLSSPAKMCCQDTCICIIAGRWCASPSMRTCSLLQAVVSFQCSGPVDSTGTAAGRQLVAGSKYGRLDSNSSLALDTALDQLSRGVIQSSSGTLSSTHCCFGHAHSRGLLTNSELSKNCIDGEHHMLCYGDAGAGSFEIRKVAYVYLAGLLASSALALVAMTAVFPWWRQTRPAIPALPVLQLAVTVMAPILFITGFAGCGSVAAALREVTSELRTLAAQIC